jgi:crotonobetainyl-CoA:carnitine CoA-transferase CaiB-like acyl-CoA transferase
MSGPLTGLRVIDLTAALAGPYGTMMLSDLGADVIKVEPPGGEVTRRVGPAPKRDDDESGPTLGGYFQSINRGKRGIVIDLKTEDGYKEFVALIRTADVVVENFGPGVVDRLGIGHATLSAINPRLVYGSLTGFGARWSGESPYIDWPAMDITIQAMAGPLSVTGTENGDPVKIGPGVGDIFPGALLMTGILAAVLEARTTGIGQQVDIAMYDAILSLTERIVYQHSYTDEVPKPIGNTHPILTPFDVLKVKDGWIAIAATTQLRWEALCRIMGQPELIDDPRFVTEFERSHHRADIRHMLDEWTVQFTRAEMTALLGGKVPYGQVNDIRDIFADPHAWARDMLVEVENPNARRPAIIAGQPLKFSRTKPAPLVRAPFLDEHGDAIRREISAAAATDKKNEETT